MQSLTLMEGLEMPLERARSLLSLGVVRRRARQKATARDVLGEARDIFTAAGAAVWARRVEEESRPRRRCACRSGPHHRRSLGRGVRRGATNKEAAADLFLSPKTVETHLTRVYRKLGVRSRSELARHSAVRTHVPEGEGGGIP